MLGLLHRTTLGKGPMHFKDHFKVMPGRTIEDPRDILGNRGFVQRSALGLVAVYNRLPMKIRGHSTVKLFQTTLQDMIKCAALDGIDVWVNLLSPRIPLDGHPLEVYGSVWASLD
jgi:hypothetical protein